MTVNEQQRYYTAIEHVLQEGEIACSRNPFDGELEFRVGDGHSVMRDLPLFNKERVMRI